MERTPADRPHGLIDLDTLRQLLPGHPSRTTVGRMVNRGELPEPLRIGSRNFWDESVPKQFVAEKRREAIERQTAREQSCLPESLVP